MLTILLKSSHVINTKAIYKLKSNHQIKFSLFPKYKKSLKIPPNKIIFLKYYLFTHTNAARKLT